MVSAMQAGSFCQELLILSKDRFLYEDIRSLNVGSNSFFFFFLNTHCEQKEERKERTKKKTGRN